MYISRLSEGAREDIFSPLFGGFPPSVGRSVGTEPCPLFRRYLPTATRTPTSGIHPHYFFGGHAYPPDVVRDIGHPHTERIFEREPRQTSPILYCSHSAGSS